MRKRLAISTRGGTAGLILACLLPSAASAVDYSLPAAIGSGPFAACAGGPGSYTCGGSVTLNNGDTVTLSANVALAIGGNLNLGNNVTLDGNGFAFTIDVGGNVNVGNDAIIAADISADGDINLGNNAQVTGNLAAGGNLDLGNNGQFTGDLSADGDIDLGNNGQVTGDIDAGGDVDVGNNASIDGNVTGDTLDFGNGTTVSGTCTPPHPICDTGGSTLDHFVITPATTAASTCLVNAITVTAENAAGDPLTDYAGSVVLSTSSGHGNWSIGGALGALSPNPDSDDNGAASYAFVAADNGDAILNLANTHAETLTITVSDPAAGVSSTSVAIGFASNVFVITEDPVQVAGRPQAMSVAMWTDDLAGSGSCGIDSNYDYAGIGIDASLLRSALDPGGAAASIGGVNLPDDPASNSVTLDFSATPGQAAFDLATTDVGQYRLTLTDNTGTHGDTPISGSSALLTVRPFGLAVSDVNVGGTPIGADPTLPGGDLFTTAGGNFSATVTAVLWSAADDSDNDGVLDGGVYTDNAPAPGYAWATALDVATAPASHWPTQAQGGVPGNLFNGVLAAADFALGTQTVDDLQYSEVGAFTLRVAAVDYLGEPSADIGGNETIVGRFAPARFVLAKTADGALQNANPASLPAFTYIGQDFGYAPAGRPAFTVTAQFLRQGVGSSGPTQNYLGAWSHIASAGIVLTAPTSDNLTVDAGGVDLIDLDYTPAAAGFAISGIGGGSFAVVFGDDSFNYPKDAVSRVPPFDSAITLTVDGVTEVGGDGVTSVAGLAFDPLPVRLRFGRLRLENAFGSELSALDMEAFVEHFDLLGGATPYWILHDDADTGVSAAQIGVQPPGTTTAGDPVADLPLGRFLIPLTAAGVDAVATVSVELDQAGFDKPWLQYDWDDGGAYDDNPSALATFGVYEGNPAQIYLRQIYP